ncbi:two-component system, OmpR family, alkaline phosphatase synthesis response regulator PhoP [Halobacillus karajensis]|uniref:Alkaline phosphatase synthesis transcriptional regulatory protein PhoP n=1 Tax=Halobacillus karajensis TaxID=195088 RepID=A0A024P780_9BACI|nr:response regulator transcription factor [Halobacillus karajensis]CDQ18275.1 Alkaline phosphatase synthesis transcriptional regulatory protein PhoP [Halobacillus karajensis]CDQ24628.1 Alkaline phosphatase synthesis transcriptional regulatory protein PhoP [Halobacillus karajensis]CDQ29125.1 Alkaline phosphatase synthesis transcriptional regulatory protein PhoP [Halobacillus karajensis]SEI06009.1 two-component system, OmpR family, alkaline phosphatase synthesis response regulator PhoP [Halobaci
MEQRILIVDDEESIVTLLKYNIEQAGYETEVAYTGTDALEKASKGSFDLIVLDVMLPGMDGMEVCKQLRQKQVNTPVLMLTAKDEEFDKVLGLELGADDYLTKPFSPREVVARIKAILRRMVREPVETNSQLQIAELSIYPEQYEATIKGESLTFTPKEFELLLYLAQNLGRVLSRDQLLSAVWNYDFAGDTRIVDVHVSHLREKIEPDTKKPVYIKTIRGLGYKMEAPQ